MMMIVEMEREKEKERERTQLESDDHELNEYICGRLRKRLLLMFGRYCRC